MRNFLTSSNFTWLLYTFRETIGQKGHNCIEPGNSVRLAPTHYMTFPAPGDVFCHTQHYTISDLPVFLAHRLYPIYPRGKTRNCILMYRAFDQSEKTMCLENLDGTNGEIMLVTQNTTQTPTEAFG